MVKSAARLDAGPKNLARSMAGAILIAAIGLSWPSGANAFLVTQIDTGGNPAGQPVYEVSGLVLNDSFSFSWDGIVAGLGGNGTLSVTGLSSTAALINVEINNTSLPTTGDDPRITNFGISVENLDPINPLGSAGTPGFYLDFFVTPNPGFPTFHDLVSACASSGGNCAGGGGGGIPAGGFDMFVLSVNGMFGEIGMETLTLDTFAIKIQGGPGDAEDSYELAGVVPLPAALPLFLSALAGLGFFGWRGNRAAA